MTNQDCGCVTWETDISEEEVVCIAASHRKAAKVIAGQQTKVVNTQGSQAVDTSTFNAGAYVIKTSSLPSPIAEGHLSSVQTGRRFQ